MIASIKKFFQNLFLKQSSREPEPLENSEIITRFIFDKSAFSSNGIKAAAFMPNPNTSPVSSSVFRKSKMSPTEYKYTLSSVERDRKKDVKAIANITIQDVFDSKLDLFPEETDYKWHADIIGWPSVKSEQKLCAQMLANKAKRE